MCKKYLKKTLQPQNDRKPLQKPLKRFDPDNIPMGTYETEVFKCNLCLAHLKNLMGLEAKKDIQLLKEYYTRRKEKYQSKIDTAHAYLIEVSSPTYL